MTDVVSSGKGLSSLEDVTSYALEMVWNHFYTQLKSLTALHAARGRSVLLNSLLVFLDEWWFFATKKAEVRTANWRTEKQFSGINMSYRTCSIAAQKGYYGLCSPLSLDLYQWSSGVWSGIDIRFKCDGDCTHFGLVWVRLKCWLQAIHLMHLSVELHWSIPPSSSSRLQSEIKVCSTLFIQ